MLFAIAQYLPCPHGSRLPRSFMAIAAVSQQYHRYCYQRTTKQAFLIIHFWPTWIWREIHTHADSRVYKWDGSFETNFVCACWVRNMKLVSETSFWNLFPRVWRPLGRSWNSLLLAFDTPPPWIHTFPRQVTHVSSTACEGLVASQRGIVANLLQLKTMTPFDLCIEVGLTPWANFSASQDLVTSDGSQRHASVAYPGKSAFRSQALKLPPHGSPVTPSHWQSEDGGILPRQCTRLHVPVNQTAGCRNRKRRRDRCTPARGCIAALECHQKSTEVQKGLLCLCVALSCRLASP